jgi:hypothetical protein
MRVVGGDIKLGGIIATKRAHRIKLAEGGSTHTSEKISGICVMCLCPH